MSTTTSNTDRKNRVKRIKRMIIFFLLMLIIIPIALCVFLIIRVNNLEKKLDKFIQHYNNQSSQYAFLDTNTENNTSDVTKEPIKVPDVQPNVGSEVTSQHVYDRKVYLTFDDGPSQNTLKILDILKQYNVKATFFVVNNDRPEAEAIYKRIVAEGHSIGVHSYTHDYNIIYKDMDGFIQDYTNMSKKIYNITGVNTKLFRFPGGSSSPYGNISKYDIARYLVNQGITYYDWNVSSADAVYPSLSAEQIIENVVDESLDKTNVMVLMHDSYGRETTVEALPQIIEQLQAANSQLLPITSETVPVQHIFINK